MRNYNDGIANYYLSYANKFGGFGDPLPSDGCCVARGEDHFLGGVTKEGRVHHVCFIRYYLALNLGFNYC
jgi:hypothetical protein